MLWGKSAREMRYAHLSAGLRTREMMKTPNSSASSVCSLCLVSCLFGLGRAAEPKGFRGDGSGRFPEAQPPKVWSKDSGVLWKCELPGTGHSSPVVAGNRLFVSAEPAWLVCVSTEGSVE